MIRPLCIVLLLLPGAALGQDFADMWSDRIYAPLIRSLTPPVVALGYAPAAEQYDEEMHLEDIKKRLRRPHRIDPTPRRTYARVRTAAKHEDPEQKAVDAYYAKHSNEK